VLLNFHPVVYNKLCAWRHNMPPPLQVDNIFAFIRQVVVLLRRSNIFIFIRQVATVLACWLLDISNKLTYWSRKWCPSHVWRGLPLWQF